MLVSVCIVKAAVYPVRPPVHFYSIVHYTIIVYYDFDFNRIKLNYCYKLTAFRQVQYSNYAANLWIIGNSMVCDIIQLIVILSKSYFPRTVIKFCECVKAVWYVHTRLTRWNGKFDTFRSHNFISTSKHSIIIYDSKITVKKKSLVKNG